MRELTEHRVNPANGTLRIRVIDGKGPGGAHHVYAVDGFNFDNNPSHLLALDLYSEVTSMGRDVSLIPFQNGAIGDVGVNGLTHEALLAILIDRVSAFQEGPYRCAENGEALWALRKALEAFKKRTNRRVIEGAEGTMMLDQADPPGRASGNPIMRYFQYAHLPEALQGVSRPVGELAQWANSTLPDGAEKSAGLRKLLEAKDCFVRCSLPMLAESGVG